MRYQASKDAVACDIGDEKALLNLNTGTYFTINSSASFIWSMLQEPQTVENLSEGLSSTYDVEQATSASDVSLILEKLRDAGLVDESEA